MLPTPLLTLLPVDKEEWQTSNAESADSEVCGTQRGITELCLYACHLITQSVNETSTSYTATTKGIALKLIQKSGKCPPQGTRLFRRSTTGSNWGLSVWPKHALPPLCAHLFPTFKWFSSLLFPSLVLVASLVPSPPPAALLSLPGSPFPFQLTCCITRSFLWAGKGEKEGTSISRASSPLSLFPLLCPHFDSLLLCPLSFHRPEWLLLARSQPSQAQSLATTGKCWTPPLRRHNTWTSNILLTCARSTARAGRLRKCNNLAFSKHLKI